ncbi:hypothetical protein BOTCAL_1092g00020 [Botryotinia calthae]|uniref:Uncharacterized protein n=1 Tax=Botryotinia calthae TaxID=38488 RepID=A0A4Y8CDP9_9HELO|nr:hypothetical protein BOTCAL_1092g00020 [Botryotinia calthae]
MNQGIKVLKKEFGYKKKKKRRGIEVLLIRIESLSLVVRKWSFGIAFGICFGTKVYPGIEYEVGFGKEDDVLSKPMNE